MRKVIISPYSKKMRDGDRPSPKDYPWWPELIELLKANGFWVIQIGLPNEKVLSADERLTGLSFRELQQLALSSDVIISVDNFFQHLCDYIGKKCYVIFGKSDPNIFGHPTNVNLLKDRKYLREKQFDMWEAEKYDEDAFVRPQEVMKAIQEGG